MTINEWFSRKTKRPLWILMCFITSTYVIFCWYSLTSFVKNQEKSFDDLIVSTVTIGIQSYNRPLVESALSRSVHNLGATAAILCKDNQVVIGNRYDIKICSDLPLPSMFEKILTFPIKGFDGYTIIFYLPLIELSYFTLFLWIMSIVSVTICLWIVSNIKKNFLIDILNPLETNLLSENTNILYEFEQIRKKINSTSKIKELENFSNGVLESKKAFSHNVKSPLRNLRLLRTNLKTAFAPDDLDLFDSAFNQISGMAEKITIKDVVSRSGSSSNKLSLGNIVDLLSKAITKKNHEWSERENPPSIELKTFEKSALISVIDCQEFASVLSNLLNNCLEAFSTTIEIKVSMRSAVIEIDILDNGTGIPTQLLSSIFNEGSTFGKSHGTGFGLYHARKNILAWKGQIDLCEKSGAGSHFRITLPSWTPPTIRIQKNTNLVIIDDKKDERERLKLAIRNCSIDNTIIEFDSANSFSTWIESDSKKFSPFMLLADNDFDHQESSGFDLIKTHNLRGNSFLVTDSHDDPELYENCLIERLDIIPKDTFHTARTSLFSYI